MNKKKDNSRFVFWKEGFLFEVMQKHHKDIHKIVYNKT